MGNTAITVEGLGKCYRLGMKEEIHDTFVGAMASWMRSPLQNFRNLKKLTDFNSHDESDDILWALRDVSFDVKQGEVLGIIGHNGAGKSTLLKILSRITDPSTGSITIDGRVASLLEVGTGFHQDLTGRENIYMNGTILGMTKKEIDRKFDEILDFSGVEKFVDTPIKRYSSGMKVRLAFSVAAHLEPEILIVDEVLAVGDSDFQKKSIGKMREVCSAGRTILFVSHNLGAISDLCNNAILLRNGKLIHSGETSFVMNSYINSMSNDNVESIAHRKDRGGNGKARICEMYFSDEEGCRTQELYSGRKYNLYIKLEKHEKLESLKLVISVYDSNHKIITQFDSYASGVDFNKHNKEDNINLYFERLPLLQGNYLINAALLNYKEILDHVPGAYSFGVVTGDYFGTKRNIDDMKEICLVNHQWKIE